MRRFGSGVQLIDHSYSHFMEIICRAMTRISNLGWYFSFKSCAGQPLSQLSVVRFGKHLGELLTYFRCKSKVYKISDK